MKQRLLLSVAAIALLPFTSAFSKPTPAKKLKGNIEFRLSFSPQASDKNLTGRMFLVISRTDSVNPRLTVGRYGTQFFGEDFVNLKPSSEILIDASTLGYPVNEFKDIPSGDYYVQVVVSKYTEFKRS